MKEKSKTGRAAARETAADQAKLDDARTLVGDRLGEQFAAKASELFCLAFAERTARGFAGAGGAASFAESMDAQPPVASALIVEFAPSADQSAARSAPRDAQHNASWEKLKEAIGEFRNQPGEQEFLSATRLVRQSQVQSARDRFHRAAGPICNEIERGARGQFRPGPEALASPTTPSAVTELCWLNDTVRTWVPPRTLAEVAVDDQVTRIDLPRRLVAEIQVTAGTVGAMEFRARTNRSGSGIIIAIIDGEVALRHPAFQDRVIQKQNYTLELWGNPDAHGTAVAGIAAGNDAVFMGMAPEAAIYNYKVLATNRFLNSDDFGGTLAIQQALEDGAHIANCSWGAGPASDGTSREARACNTAWTLGLTIVKSAGNQGPGAATLTTPADADGVIVIGATDSAGAVTQEYSSRGPTTHGHKRPHFVAPGGTSARGIFSCLVNGGFGDCGRGTSFAAPHVTGLLALILQNDPDLDPDELRQRLLDCCTALDEEKNVSGAGLVSLANFR